MPHKHTATRCKHIRNTTTLCLQGGLNPNQHCIYPIAVEGDQQTKQKHTSFTSYIWMKLDLTLVQTNINNKLNWESGKNGNQSMTRLYPTKIEKLTCSKAHKTRNLLHVEINYKKNSH
jgi:hypothetical protein